MGTIEKSQESFDYNLRVLYIPLKIVDRSAQIEYGRKLIKDGHTVFIHEHSASEICTPNGVRQCGELTLAEDRAILVSDSTTETPQATNE